MLRDVNHGKMLSDADRSRVHVSKLVHHRLIHPDVRLKHVAYFSTGGMREIDHIMALV